MPSLELSSKRRLQAAGREAASVGMKTLRIVENRACLLGEASLLEGEMHLVIDHLALRVQALQDLSQHIHCLLAAQPRLLGLELFQQVLGGHGLPCQVAAHGVFSHLNVAAAGG